MSSKNMSRLTCVAFHGMIPVGEDGQLVEGMSGVGPYSTREMISDKLINHFN